MEDKQIPQNEGMDNKKKKGKKVALLVSGCVVGALVCVYLLLCVWTGLSGSVLPNVYVGPLDVGGMSQREVLQTVERWADAYYGDTTYVLYSGDARRNFAGTHVVVDAQRAAQQAWDVGRSEMFLQRGAVIVTRLLGWEKEIVCQPDLSEQGEAELERILLELNQEVGTPLIETVWSVDGDALVITGGVAGRWVNRPQTRAQLLAAMADSGQTRVEVTVVTAEPKELNLDEVYSQIHTEPQDAQIDEQTHQATQHVVGIDFDLEQAKVQFAALAEGETTRIPLTITMPAKTREGLNALLFRDELGRCETNIGGTANRLSNVITAAKSIDGIVLAPGQVFSYNDALGPRTVANGYKAAPAYIGGQTVDEVGGGICQDSSTLYMAVLRANLEIVERTNHMYTVGYVPNGMDATVVYNAIDFKFKNNTEYPVRIRAIVEGRKLTVTVTGTKTQPFTVKLFNETLSTTPYEVVYKPDDTVAPGTTVVETTAYTGCKVRVYRCVYDGEGNLLSRTLESTNNYRHRDKVILYNPVDAVSLGLADAQETVQPVQPEPEPIPEPTPAPQPEPEQPAELTPEPEVPEQVETPVAEPEQGLDQEEEV